jgi:hypothetical protein
MCWTAVEELNAEAEQQRTKKDSASKNNPGPKKKSGNRKPSNNIEEGTVTP